MIASDIISKTDFSEFLKKTFINVDDILSLLFCLKQIPDVQSQEKLAFLLYNNYISYEEIFLEDNTDYDTYILKIMKNIDENIIDSNYVSKIENLLYTHFFDNAYSKIRKYNINDFLITLSFEDYKDLNSISMQLNIVYESLTDFEKEILHNFYNKLSINQTENYLNPLVRIKTKKDFTEHAIIEKKEYLNRAMGFILDNIDTMKSIFNKISSGTIH